MPEESGISLYTGAVMKKRAGKAGITLIFAALSAIAGYVCGEALRNKPLDLTKLRKDDGHTEHNKPA